MTKCKKRILCTLSTHKMLVKWSIYPFLVDFGPLKWCNGCGFVPRHESEHLDNIVDTHGEPMVNFLL